MISRRSFLGQATATGLAAASELRAGTAGPTGSASTLFDLLRIPDTVTAFPDLKSPISLQYANGAFQSKQISVRASLAASELRIVLAAPNTPLTHVHVRWQGKVASTLVCLGDHWERSYGDLGWRGNTPERVLPWYFTTYDGSALHAYGVKTGAAALCFWQIDPEGISLWLDVRNGGDPVLLKDRELAAATVVTRGGAAGESPVAALRTFCKQLCRTPRLPKGPIFGANDWYCAYGDNSEEMLLWMAALMAEVSPPGNARPFTVVDMGWSDNSAKFPSMASFAEKVRKLDSRPGIWIRPLLADPGTDERLLLPAKRFGKRSERTNEIAFDPTIPDALEAVKRKLRQARDWKFDLVKHDFSTYDLLGQWGFEMGAMPTISNWSFHDRTRTNAEIVLEFYKAIRGALGEDTLVLGCNTIGHLSAGIFEMQRSGDDTSGRVWERTRRMGVNTLAYRLPQHGTFFCLDADCVGITKEVPWELNRQWLDLLAHSTTALFVSPAEDSVGAEQRKALKQAFKTLVSSTNPAEPSDFFHETTPETWNLKPGKSIRYRWCPMEGALPFEV
jgi:alpha-galactosidase